VVEVNPGTGARTLISGGGRGSGPALETPDSVAVEASGDILVPNERFTGGTQLLRPASPAAEHTLTSGPAT
jgi:hypothetical protein